MTEKIIKTEEEWRKILSPQQYKIMREKGTEAPFSCSWEKHEKGAYHCAACDLPIFEAETKFESGTGWPSYFKPINQDSVTEKEDWSLGLPRTEIICSRCESHLGHVFPDLPRRQAGGPAPTGKRYCINSIALNFQPDEK